MRPIALSLVLLLTLACGRKPEAAPPQAPVPTEVPLPEFTPCRPALEGTLVSVGSDSMDPLVQLWVEDLKAAHPGLKAQVLSRGSGTAPKALLAGQTRLGHMSREMTREEVAAFEAAFGYPPTRIVVAIDALAIYVNANNPVKQLSLEQVDALFSTTRKGGYTQEVQTWGDLGLGQEWNRRAVQPFGRDENSGTRAFFREHVLKKGDFKPAVKALPDQFAVVEAPAMEAGGISYGPIQHSVRMVRAVPLVDFGAEIPAAPTLENILSRKYPLTRFLYLYVNQAPGGLTDPVAAEFVRLVLSRQGQAAVARFGAIPLPGDLARQNLGKLH